MCQIAPARHEGGQACPPPVQNHVCFNVFTMIGNACAMAGVLSFPMRVDVLSPASPALGGIESHWLWHGGLHFNVFTMIGNACAMAGALILRVGTFHHQGEPALIGID